MKRKYGEKKGEKIRDETRRDETDWKKETKMKIKEEEGREKNLITEE